MTVISNRYTTVSPPVREMIHFLKLIDYLLVCVDKQPYNFTSLFLPFVVTRVWPGFQSERPILIHTMTGILSLYSRIPA